LTIRLYNNLSAKLISKVLEINNCNKDTFLEVIYNSTKFWEIVSPAEEIKADFISPNVLHTIIKDKIPVINFTIEWDGELVFIDKGDEEGKGRLIEFNVRNNKDIKKLEGNLRIKQIGANRIKVGIFISIFILNNDFLNLIGKNVAEFTLRTKITEILRNLEKYCKSNELKNLL